MIVSAPLSAKEALRFRFRSPKRNSRGSSRSSSLDHRRPFQPQVNKSFTCYQEVQVPLPSKKNRSFSVERSRNISLGEIKPIRKAILTGRHRIMKSTSKLDNGHPGPRELEEGLHRKELINAIMEQGNTEMRNAHYVEAIKYFKRVLKEDSLHLDAMYNRAVSYMHISQHKLAIPDLVTVARENPSYDRQLYIALAMCFIASNDYVTAVRQLTKGLIKFPKFAEGYITRGQLYNQQQRWDKAVTDFYKAIALNPRDGSAYVGLADSLIGLGDTKAALQVLNQAIHDHSCAPQALLKRSKIWLQYNDFEKGLKDIEAYISKGGENAEAYFNRGIVLEKLGQDVEAALSFEQAIKYDNQKLYIGQAIYKLGAIKIKQKDFYGAMYTFKRAIDAKIQIKDQTHIRQYAEAVLNLMKRKYKEGIHQLSKLVRKKPSQIKEYIGSCYAYRGFGYCANEQYEKALKDFTSAKKMSALDKASSYNKLLCEGIIAGEKKDYSGATELFSRAERQFERNVEPLAYKAMVLMCVLRETSQGKDKLIYEAKEFLDKAITMRDTESDLYFFRGLLYYYLQKPVDGIPDFEMAIEKAEDNVPSHYIGRGLCYAALKLYKEAIQDFTIAIQLDENLSDAYFYRGRCAFIVDDTSLAFVDFQKLILTNPDDPVVHIHAGNLLLLTGSYEDAAKAFANANSLETTAEAEYQKAKCHMLLGDIASVLKSLAKIKELKGTDSLVDFDQELLTILKQASEISNSSDREAYSKCLFALTKLLSGKGELCKPTHLHFFRGVLLFYMKDYVKAGAEFRAALGPRDLLEAYRNDEGGDSEDSNDVLFNLSLCYAMKGEYENAAVTLQETIYIADGPNKGQLLFLLGLLQLAMEQHVAAKELMMEAFKFDPETISAYLEDQEAIEVLPLACDNPLSKQFPLIKVSFGSSNPIWIRPSFSLPKVEMPSMDFSVEPKVLEYFKMRAVKCKPEAPWLNRVNGTIQFTEELHEAGSETVSVTENSDHEEKPEPMESSQDLISTAPRRQYKSCVDFSKKFDTSEDEEHLDENTAEIFASVMKRKEEQYSEEEEALVFTPDHIVKRIDKICSPDNKFNKYPSYD